MSTFTLAADPPVHPSVLFSGFVSGSVRLLNNNSFIVDGHVGSGAEATVAMHGTGFGNAGAGLLSGAARVMVIEFTVGGRVMMRVDDAWLTGSKLVAWLDGDGMAFEEGVFVFNDTITLSNLPEYQDAYSGSDYVDGRGGDDTLLGSSGNDTLVGGAGENWLEGGPGNDLIVSSAGGDWADGGAGIDTFFSASALRNQVEATFLSWGAVLTGPSPQGEDILLGIERIAFLDGTLHLDPADAAGQVWRLYGAAFGREAETTGLSGWVGALDGGVSLAAAAAGFIGSAEFALRYGSLDDTAFITRLYANVLGRTPDTAGLEGWKAFLAGGASRADLLVGFSESAENRMATDPGIAGGLWTVDPEAMDVLRCYMTVLGRQPDAEGLAHWITARDGGLPNWMMVAYFITSPEFQARFGDLSNEEFVSRLYLSALGRPADEQGLTDWTLLLETRAVTRHELVAGFAQSDEMTMKLLPLISDGIAFA